MKLEVDDTVDSEDPAGNTENVIAGVTADVRRKEFELDLLERKQLDVDDTATTVVVDRVVAKTWLEESVEPTKDTFSGTLAFELVVPPMRELALE